MYIKKIKAYIAGVGITPKKKVNKLIKKFISRADAATVVPGEITVFNCSICNGDVLAVRKINDKSRVYAYCDCCKTEINWNKGRSF